MQIVVTFNDFEEMEDFAKKVLEKKPLTAAELNESAKKTAEIINAAEAKEEAEKQEEAPEVPFKEDKKGVDESQVKVLLSEKLKAGKKAEVKELFGKYGVEKLSELIEKHPDKLAEFYSDAEGI